MSAQLNLFGDEDPAERGRGTRQTRGEDSSAPIAPAEVRPQHVEIAEHLPATIRLGTSSWSFPGWQGLVHGERCSERRLSRRGLTAYAHHPLLRTVGLDRTHYAPMTREQFAEHAAQVEPIDTEFRFLVKAHEVLTLRRFPDHPRYASRRGQENEQFLDPEYAATTVVEPMLAGLGRHAGPLLFQVAPQDLRPMGGAEGFIDALHRFLLRLPAGPTYAVEVRNRELMRDGRLAAALADAGAVPCLSAVARLPDLVEQWRATGAGRSRQLLVRWMVHQNQTYRSATERYAPFDRLVDEDPQTRTTIARLAAGAAEAGQPIDVIVNNKAEGSAPLSVFKLAQRIAEELAAPG